MRSALSQTERYSTAEVNSVTGARPAGRTAAAGLAFVSDGLVGHGRAGIRSSYPAHASRVPQPKVP